MRTCATLTAFGCVAILAAAGTARAASLSNADKQFLSLAAKTDMTEAHEGQMAEEQATRAEVKAFARTLVQDHTDSYERLTALAGKNGVSIPKGIDSAKDREIERLNHLKGARFDSEFTRDEIADHRRALAVYEREAKHGEDADVRDYAAKMIPILEKHLQLAEQCAKPAGRS